MTVSILHMPVFPADDGKLPLLEHHVCAVDQIVQGPLIHIGQLIGRVALAPEIKVPGTFLIKAGVDLGDL